MSQLDHLIEEINPKKRARDNLLTFFHYIADRMNDGSPQEEIDEDCLAAYITITKEITSEIFKKRTFYDLL